jgi:hypothetical protein
MDLDLRNPPGIWYLRETGWPVVVPFTSFDHPQIEFIFRKAVFLDFSSAD